MVKVLLFFKIKTLTLFNLYNRRDTIPSLTSTPSSPVKKASTVIAVKAAPIIEVPVSLPVPIYTSFTSSSTPEAYTSSMLKEVLDKKEFTAVYLITGATGFIGKHLIGKILSRSGSIVLAITRPSSVGKLFQGAERNVTVLLQNVFTQSQEVII